MMAAVLLEHTLRGIRIITAGMSSLLGDMVVRSLARRWRIESITRLELSRDLTERLSGMVADLVVAERVSGASNAITADLLTIRPDISLLELSANGRMAWFYRTGSPMSVLVDFSAQDLIDMLGSGGVGGFANGATRGDGA
jgi:hypothetical protein